MSAPHRRGACPGLSAPMLTGDGLLVRFMPVDAISLDAFVAICAAAREHGNGVMEITARGSVQVRGLTADSAPRFATAMAALDIAAVEGVPVIADPLAEDPERLIDATTLAAGLRRALAGAGLALAPKLSVVVTAMDVPSFTSCTLAPATHSSRSSLSSATEPPIKHFEYRQRLR